MRKGRCCAHVLRFALFHLSMPKICKVAVIQFVTKCVLQCIHEFLNLLAVTVSKFIRFFFVFSVRHQHDTWMSECARSERCEKSGKVACVISILRFNKLQDCTRDRKIGVIWERGTIFKKKIV